MKRYCIYVLVAAAALSACSSKEEPVNLSDGKVSIIARAAEPMVTKTVVDESTSHDHSEGRTYLLWNDTDEIGVFATSTDEGVTTFSTNVCFSNNLTSGSSKGIADFTGTLASGEIPELAYYPYSSMAGSDMTKISGTIPAAQEFDTETRRIPSDYKIGGLAKTVKDGETVTGYEFYFTNILSLFCIGVDATGTDLEGETLESVRFTFPEGSVTNGDFTVNLQTRAISLTASETPNQIALNWSGSARTLSGDTQIFGYLSCAPFSARGKDVTIEVTTDASVASFKTPLKVDFAPGFIYHFPLTLKNWAGAEGWSVTARQ